MAAAPPEEIVVSTHEDGSPFIVVGAGLSPRDADVVLIVRIPSDGSPGPTNKFVADGLSTSVDSFQLQGDDQSFDFSEVSGKLIVHVPMRLIDETSTSKQEAEIRELLSIVHHQMSKSKPYSLWVSTGDGSEETWQSSSIGAHALSTFFEYLFTRINVDRRNFSKILVAAAPEVTPDVLAKIAKAFTPKKSTSQTEVESALKFQTTKSNPTPKPTSASNLEGVFDDPPEENPAPTPTPEPPLEQKADFRSDRPVTSIKDDALDRAAIARAIYEKVHTFWTEDQGPPPKYPFMVHIAGRWGAGKSTILNFLAELLDKDTSLTPPTSGHTKEPRKNWVVVNFNAWQHQAQRPAWWSLYNAVADQAAAQMDRPSGFTFQDRWFRFLINGGKVTLSSALAVIVLFLGLLAYSSFTSEEPKNVTASVEVTTTTTDAIAPDTAPTTTKKTIEKEVDVTKQPDAPKGPGTFLGMIAAIATSLGAIFVIWSGLQKFFGRTQDIADALIASDDPTAKLKKRFETMIGEIHRPVAIFIDDLDRCDADYVVELLQAIQTIYVDVPVLYVVAADRDWIVSAYDQSYKDFKTDIDQPGQPLGYLFVKKIFQLSVNIPDLDGDYGRNFLTSQLKGNVDDEVTPEDEETIRTQIQDAPDFASAIEVIEKQSSPAAKRYAGAQSFDKYMTEAAQEELKHLLEETLCTEDEMLFDPNPRAIKRLVNAYSFRSGFALIAGQTDAIDKLPYWCALDLRFPYSAERLSAFPILATEDAWISDGQSRDDDGNLVGINTHFPKEDQAEIAKLMAHLNEEDIKALRVYG